MNIEESIRQEAARIRGELGTGKAASAAEIAADLGSVYSHGSVPRLKAREYLRAAIGWVYGCVNVIADELAGTELRMVRVVKGVKEEVDDHPALDIIYRANNAMTRFDLIQLVGQYLELTGEAPLFVSFRKGAPDSLILLRPDRLVVKPGKNGEMIGGYEYSVNGDRGVQTLKLEPWEVVHLKYSDPDNPMRGKGPLQAAAATYDLDQYAEKWQGQFFKNSASPSAALQTDKVLSKETREKLRAKIQERYEGIDNAHKTIILENGLKWQQISLSQKDMDFVMQQQFSRDKLLAIFRVPKTSLGLTEDVNRANAEATDYVFAKRTIKPKLQRIVEQLNEFFLPLFPDTDDLYIDFMDPVPQNTELLIRQAESGVTAGYMTLNEARGLMGLDPIDGGDELRDPATFAPAQTQEGLSLTGKKAKSLATAYQKQTSGRRGRIAAEAKAKQLAIQKRVQEAIAPIISTYMKSKAGKPRAALFDGKASEVKEQKWAFQEKQLGLAKTAEEKIAAKVVGMFAAQEAVVLRALESGEKKVLDVEKETDRYADAVRPVMISLLRGQAKVAMQLVGGERGFTKGVGFTQRLVEEFDQHSFKVGGGVARETNDKLRALFKEASEKERGIPEIASGVKALFADMAQYRAERIARTESIDATNLAAERAWEESGVVERKEWLAVRDTRTDEECAALDGKDVEIGGEFSFKNHGGGDSTAERPPLHPNCRCTLIPVVGTPLREGTWRPTMTPEQANAFTEGSKLKATLYHGTNDKAAAEIGLNGFDKSHQPAGDGLYLALDRKASAGYAQAVAEGKGGAPAVLAVRVKAETYRRFKDTESFIAAVEAQYGEITEAKATQFLAQYDAVKIDSLGYVIVGNPKNVVTIRK